MEKDLADNIYNNLMNLFFEPEIRDRKKQGRIGEDFKLIAAQALFFPDGKPQIIRLNEEVSVQVKLKKGVDSTVDGFWPSKDDVEYIRPNEKQYLNCGHVTLLLLKDAYQLTFDFQYNKKACEEHLLIAKQFLATSKYALENNHLVAFIDNSFSTIELLAKIDLLLATDKNVSGKTNHKAIQSAFNKRHKKPFSEFEEIQRNIFNKLFTARNKARYLHGTIVMDRDEMLVIYRALNDMFDNMSKRLSFE